MRVYDSEVMEQHTCSGIALQVERLIISRLFIHCVFEEKKNSECDKTIECQTPFPLRMTLMISFIISLFRLFSGSAASTLSDNDRLKGYQLYFFLLTPGLVERIGRPRDDSLFICVFGAAIGNRFSDKFYVVSNNWAI